MKENAVGAAREHVEHYLELWNNGDFDKVRAGLADDLVWVSPTGSITGAEAVITRFRSDLTAFPDRRLTVSKWVEDGDTVVIVYEWTGTHTGSMAFPDGVEVAPSGQRVTIPGADVFEVRDGKTVEHRSYFDQLPVMMQGGIVAPAQQG